MAGVAESVMKLAELVRPNAIVAELTANDRAGAIRELIETLRDAKLIAAGAVDGIVRSIIARERSRGTTGFGKGMAVPHAKVDKLEGVIAAVGRTSRGIEFASLDGQPVFGIFLILSPTDRADEHIRAMDLIYRHLQHDKFRKFFRQTDEAAKIYDLLKEADEQLIAS